MVVVKERDVFERSVAFASLEYKVIEKNMGDYQRLYRFVVLENVGDVYQLAELMGNRLISEVSQMKRVLLGYLKVLFGGSVDLGVVAESVCPSCFCRSLVDVSGNGEFRRSCSCCGLELGDEYGSFRDFSQNLDFDVTLAPVSQLSYTKVGGTFNPRERKNCPDHQGFLYDVVNRDNVLFVDFAKGNPDLAALLDCEGVEVIKDGFVFCRMDSFVRRCSVDEFFEAKMKFWHEFDAMLRKSKLEKQLTFKGDCSREKAYGLGLCRRFGFDNTSACGDQAMYNTLGVLLEKYKPLVAMLDRRVSCEVFVDSVFYICVLWFGHGDVVGRVKGELRVDSGLVAFLDKVMCLVSDANSRVG